MIISFQRYFAGVTIVAAYNAVVIGVAALLLGVPLAGTIAVVTFVSAYIPYIGAFFAGAFAVVIALGSEGTTDRSNHARRRDPRQRRPAEHPPADRLRGDPEAQPARRPHRHDRRR